MSETVVTLERVSGTTFTSNTGKTYVLSNAFAKDNVLRVWQSTLISALKQRLIREVR